MTALNNELISVVIPAFNAGRFLAETIQSVLGQTHECLEVIVVDDGSKDNTQQVVEGIRRSDTRIRLITQPNSGVSVARNAGASVSRGAFIAFLDADDTLAPNSLQLKLEKLVSDASLGLVHCDYQEMDAESRRYGPTHSFLKEGHVLDELLLLDEGTSFFSLSSCLMRMEIFKRAGAFDRELSNCADHEFLFRVAKLCRVGRAPHLGFYYRIHPNNMHSNIKLLEKDLVVAYEKADDYNLFRNSLFRRRCYGNMYFVLAGCWWNDEGDKWRGTRYLLRALWTYPPTVFRLARKLRHRARFTPHALRR